MGKYVLVVIAGMFFLGQSISIYVKNQDVSSGGIYKFLSWGILIGTLLCLAYFLKCDIKKKK